MRYTSRQTAGRLLAEKLTRFRGENTTVLALPRGGVVLGLEVSRVLGAPLGLVLVRKIGHPSNPEYAVGAMAEGEEPIYNQNEVADLDESWRRTAEAAARNLIEQRRKLYFGDDFEPPKVKDKTVIIVDDGIATGLTMMAAAKAVRNRRPRRLIVAVPVAASDSLADIESLADEVVVLDNPDDFLGAVGSHYEEFPQVEDDEVKTMLEEANI